MIPRIDELDGPPVVGKYYMVPTVRGFWYEFLDDWPIIGPKHHDKHCLNFEWQHYHLDARFIRSRSKDYGHWRSVAAAPLVENGRINIDGLPAPVYQRRRCLRLENPFQAKITEESRDWPERNAGWRCHFEEWQGRQAKRDSRGWVCPHRNVSLASQSVVDGVITCPLHQLRIDAATGLVLAPKGGAA